MAQPVSGHHDFPTSVAICRHLTSLSLLLHSYVSREELLEVGVKNATSVLRTGIPDTLRTLIIVFNDCRALPFLPPQSSATISAIRDFSDTIIAIQDQRAQPLALGFQIVEARRHHVSRWPEALAETFPALHSHFQPNIAFMSTCESMLFCSDPMC